MIEVISEDKRTFLSSILKVYDSGNSKNTKAAKKVTDNKGEFISSNLYFINKICDKAKLSELGLKSVRVLLILLSILQGKKLIKVTPAHIK